MTERMHAHVLRSSVAAVVRVLVVPRGHCGRSEEEQRASQTCAQGRTFTARHEQLGRVCVVAQLVSGLAVGVLERAVGAELDEHVHNLRRALPGSRVERSVAYLVLHIDVDSRGLQ